jgi:hypothetical protein
VTNTIRIPLAPQPPRGVKVVMISGNRDLDGSKFYYHAITEAQGDDTIFYHSTMGLPGDKYPLGDPCGYSAAPMFEITDLNVDCVDGEWCWVVDGEIRPAAGDQMLTPEKW